MKRFILLVAAISFFSLTSVCDAAECWVPFIQQGSTSFYYDANSLSYSRDNLGDTPFIQVRLKCVENGAVTQDKVWLIDPDVTMRKVLGATNVFDDWNLFRQSEWRLARAVKLWKQANPQ